MEFALHFHAYKILKEIPIDFGGSYHALFLIFLIFYFSFYMIIFLSPSINLGNKRDFIVTIFTVSQVFYFSALKYEVKHVSNNESELLLFFIFF